MMRWPSAYCATSSGTSRSIMRSSTHPTWPEEFRTMYQSSIAGLGGSATFVLSAAMAAPVFAADAAGGVGEGAGVVGPPVGWPDGLGDELPPAAGGGEVGFWSLPAG